MCRDIWREGVGLWFLCVSATCVVWIGVVGWLCVDL
jgi:hypothetical protein